MEYFAGFKKAAFDVACTRCFLVAVFLAFALLPAGGCKGRQTAFGKDVVAVVNGQNITVEDLRLMSNGEIPKSIVDRESTVRDIITNRLVSKVAIDKGLMADKEVYSRLESFYTEELPKYLRRRIVLETKIPEDEMLERKKSLNAAPILRVAIICTQTLGEAESMMADIKKGADFEKVADKSSGLGGGADREIDLNDDLYPVGVRAALNSMTPGSISNIMKIDIGYAIFKVKARMDPEEIWKAREYGVREEMVKKKVDAEMASLLDKLRGSAKITLDKRVQPDGEVQYRGATVNGVSMEMDPALFESADNPHAPHRMMNPATLMNHLNNLINNYLYAQEARRRGVQYDPEFMKLAALKKEEIYTIVYMERVKGTYEATPQDIKDYYNKNKAGFMLKPEVRISRILLATNQDALAVLKELKSGKDFATLARTKSIDKASAANGGDVGFLTTEDMKEPLKGAISKLKTGEVSDVLKSEYGYEILKATDRHAGGEPDMSQITDTIKKRVELTKVGDRVNAFYKALSDKADIRINRELLKSL